MTIDDLKNGKVYRAINKNRNVIVINKSKNFVVLRFLPENVPGKYGEYTESFTNHDFKVGNIILTEN